MSPDKWRHKKRGTIYEVIGTVTLQCSPFADLSDDEELLLYRDDGGRLWARRAEEFHDGRFEKVAT